MFTNVAGSDEQQKMLKEGRVLAVPEGSVIDTGSQQIVYREASPGVFEAIDVTIGPRMTGPDGATFYPVLKGLKRGERVVTTGSFLVRCRDTAQSGCRFDLLWRQRWNAVGSINDGAPIDAGGPR